MRVSHTMAAEGALAMVNTEAELDYWLPGDPHLARAVILDGVHLAANSPAPPPCSPGPPRPFEVVGSLEIWRRVRALSVLPS